MKYIPFSLKTRINRGSRYRKIDLCIKECLESKKNPQVMKFREKLSLLKIRPRICHLVTHVFSQINH